MASFNVDIGGVTVKTTVVKSASMLDSYVSELRALLSATGSRNPIIGLDVEWKPNSTAQRVSILQLCAGTRVLIIQLCYLNVIPQSLKNLIADAGISFLGVGITEDIRKLSNDYGLGCSSAIELGPLASRVLRNPDYSNSGLAALASQVVGLNIEKSSSTVTCSNWANDPLTAEQIKYATIDAYASYLIGKKLLE
ncbi:hypothetical protein NE237_030612 [Protea cynaroides]|uniref:3'-5' exonuclease domain-containing protein n=1 Tax=Protea cynaroides TaxID=273540 RepID=A0A9Q0JX55_9MAGN|nr:hypothetical protein NE237_030612 [Protea cynaroides]